MIQVSDADVKLVVVSPKVLTNEKYQRAFEKVAISQRRLGFAMHGDFIDGTKIIENPDFLENEFRAIISHLLSDVEKYGKAVSKPTQIQPPEPPSVDKVEEKLLSNLFPVKKYPSSVFVSPTQLRTGTEVFRKLGSVVSDYPFLPKNRNLYTFCDLRKPSSPFLPIISEDKIAEERVSEWLEDGDRRNDMMYLLNLALRKYCQKRTLWHDKEHHRFVCRLIDGRNNVFTLRAGTKLVRRAVARKVYGKNGNLLYCTHYSAYLKFMLIRNELFLKIEPTITFTSNGFLPIRPEKLASLMSRYLSKQYNVAYLNLVRFWAKYLSKLDAVLSIPVGDQMIEIDVNPVGTLMSHGIKQEGDTK